MKTLLKYKEKFFFLALILFSSVVLMVSLRGLYGNPTSLDLNSDKWQVNGPFELSPERGRFALIYSLVEDKSFQFSNSLGKFATPDVGINNKGQFVSLFAPLLSFLAIPGYIIGKFFGASQVGTFATVALFALFNLILIRLIAIRLGAKPLAATIASFIFLFATPAFAYAVNLYQHHISTFLILLSIYVLLKSQRAWALAIVFFLCALAIPLDYPNLFFMFPIGLYALGRIISFKKIGNNLATRINIPKALTILVVIIPLVFFLWFNYVSYGNPLQLSGTLQTGPQVTSTKDLASLPNPAADQKETNTRNALSFFKTRNILNGFYIQFLSPDRGIIYYTPVVIFGFLGFILAYKKRAKMTALLISIIGANILLYEMWGDPWGGWAFGSRYLIPAYAILAIFIALLLTYWGKKIILLAIFLPVTIYSIAINTLGAITTSSIPPQVEVLQLEKISGLVQRYTYQRNWEFLLAGNSKSFFYQTFLKQYTSPLIFYIFLTSSICILITGILIFHYIFSKKETLNG